MKSVLGLFGLAVLSASCGGNGEALFDDIAGQSAGGSASGAANHGGSGANASGGSSNHGGTSGGNVGGSNANSGTSGTAGTDTVGGEPNGGAGPNPGPEVIYVALSGNDSADCGLTQQAPCKSISQGVARGAAASRADVYVQAGTYAGVVVLKAGIHVLGGFDDNWQGGARADAAHQVVIQGALDADSKEYVAVWAHDLATQASLENMLITAPDAEGQKAGSLDGRSSYGVHAVSAKLLLKDIDVQAGNGAKGADGANGQDAVATAATDAMNGTTGGAGISVAVPCSLEQSGGGLAGMNSCSASPSTVDMTGGKGGSGGARDTKCTPIMQTWLWDYTAQAGEAGANAVTVSGTAGKGGAQGSGGGPVGIQNPNDCGATSPGNPGIVENGSGGGKAASGGKLTGEFWYALAGGDGGTGKNGGGGGGGGGSGGCDSKAGGGTDARGAGGGGGGAGGCAARTGGGGGGGGGGSFGVFAIGSTIDVNGVTITRASGGAGGKGGAGGQGQSGGLGKAGGLHPGTATPGVGANGGHGGHAGGGAGGNGGVSISIALNSGGTLNGTVNATGGAAGPGGAGGASAPNAAEIERDGNSGEAGNAGTLGETVEL